MALSFRFVNQMLNVAYLTGFVRKSSKSNCFLLQQNNNLEHAIEILVKPDFTLPREFTPVTVTCHVRGKRETNSQVPGTEYQTCVIHAIDIERPSTRAMPASATWVMGGGRNGEDFKPFDENGSLRSGVTELTEENEGKLSETEEIIRNMIDATKGRLDSRMRSISNAALISGLVDGMTYIPPNEHQSHGYGLIWLRQNEDQSVNIPIRLVSPRAKSIMRSISVGHPIKVAGRLRRKLMLNEPGEVIGHTMMIETDDLYRAIFKQDILATPSWWSSVVDRLREKKGVATNAKGEATTTTATTGSPQDPEAKVETVMGL